jgi:hypothetical protein
MTPCDWNDPGAHRYTGSVAAAIAAYGLPLATQQALVAAFEARAFDDTVVIDRDSIRGRAHGYEPQIRDMHFGSAGRICTSVDRSSWPAAHVETALVVCAGAECIGWPAVCGNVFRLRRAAAAPEAGAWLAAVEAPAPLPGVLAAAADEPGAGPDADTAAPALYGPALAFVPPAVGGGWGGTVPGPIPAVPESSTRGLMLVGLALLAWLAWRGQRGARG